MSKNHAQDTTTPASGETNDGLVIGTTVHVAPGTLLLDRNIRDAQPDADLVKSVRAVGVLQPIGAVVTPDAQLRVRFGQRRTLAAITADRDTVPVYLLGAEQDEDTAATEARAEEVQRIITQRDENTHRAGLTTSEEVAVVEQLTAFGLSAAQIAKQARIKRTDVDAAIAVSGSPLARAASDRYADLTLDQAAVVAEFEEDPETIKALVVAAHEGRFEHVAQRARDDRKEAQARQIVTEDLTSNGVRIIDRPPYDSTTARLTGLVDAKTEEPVTVENHASCPGHVAWLTYQWVWVDAQGNCLDEDSDLSDEQTAETTQERQWCAVFACENPTQHGHRDRYRIASSPHRTAADDQTPEQREQAKAARALVIENNKAWASAETVRRTWLAEFAKRKTPPKGAAAFLATALSRDTHTLTSGDGNTLAADWLGKKKTGYGPVDLSPTKSATEHRALVIALVQVLACYEATTDKSTWRHDGTHNAAGRYLRFLERSGYTLAEVEQYAISHQTA